MRKRVALAFGLLALVLLGVYLVLWATGPEAGVSPAAWREVREGMNAAEVEALLGRRDFAEVVGDIICYVWEGPDRDWDVYLNPQGRVAGKGVSETREPTSALLRLRHWLGIVP